MNWLNRGLSAVWLCSVELRVGLDTQVLMPSISPGQVIRLIIMGQLHKCLLWPC